MMSFSWQNARGGAVQGPRRREQEGSWFKPTSASARRGLGERPDAALCGGGFAGSARACSSCGRATGFGNG